MSLNLRGDGAFMIHHNSPKVQLCDHGVASIFHQAGVALSQVNLRVTHMPLTYRENLQSCAVKPGGIAYLGMHVHPRRDALRRDGRMDARTCLAMGHRSPGTQAKRSPAMDFAHIASFCSPGSEAERISRAVSELCQADTAYRTAVLYMSC